ncbi:MAG: LamB/YcsF family protein, partial [Gammaproteobacteria bacterium]
MSQNILINCDMGECLNPDPDPIIMPLIDMANIACGGHAGDDNSMVKTIQLAKKFNVSVGAHPSYEDKENFGRVSQKVTIDELKKSIYHQLEVFTNHCFDNELKFN